MSDELSEALIKSLRRVASAKFRPAFQRRKHMTKGPRRVATSEIRGRFNRRYATNFASYDNPGVETPV